MKKILKKFLKFIFILFSILVVALAGVYFLRNFLITGFIEKAGSKAFKAKVNVYGLNLNVFSPELTFDSFVIADSEDPFKNILETGKAKLGIEVKPLLDKKVIINSMVIENLQTGTKRKTSGAVSVDSKNKEKDSWIKNYAFKKLEEEKSNIPVLNPDILKSNLDPKKLAENLDLITPVKIDEAKVYLEERKNFWKEHLEKQDYKNRIENIKKDIDNINSNNNKSVLLLPEGIERIDHVLHELKKLKKDLKADRNLAKEDLKKLEYYRKSLPLWIKEDYKKASQTVSLDKGILENAGELLFGKRFSFVLDQTLQLADKIMLAGEKSSGTKIKDERDVKRVEKYPDLPFFWIKETKFSCIFEQKKYTGNLLNITDNQNRTGFPVSLNVLNNEKDNKFLIKGNLDFRDNKKDLSIDFKLQDFGLSNFLLFSDNDLSLGLKSALADCSGVIKVKPQFFEAVSDLKLSKIVFDDSADKISANILLKIFEKALKSAPYLNLNCLYRIQNNESDFLVKTNIDSLVQNEISSQIDNQIKKAEKEVKDLISKDLKSDESEFLSYLNSVETSILQDINGSDSEAGSLKALIEKKKHDLKKKAFKNFDIKF